MCCSCCDLKLNQDELKENPVWQAWLWCIVATAIWTVWMSFLQKMQGEIAAEVNVKNITAADFSVWMSNLPRAASDNKVLRQYAEHYGEVAAAFQIQNVGNVLDISNKVAAAETQLAEVRELFEEPADRKAACWGLWDFGYRRFVCGLFSSSSAAHERIQV